MRRMKRKRGTTLRALLAVLLLGLLTTAVALAADPVLTFVEVQRNGVDGVDGLESARSVTLSPDGKHLYAVAFFSPSDSMAVFSRNSTTGALTFVQVLNDDVGGVDGLSGASSVAVSPDGKHLYSAGEGEDKLGVFSRNSTTGVLTFTEFQQIGVGSVLYR